MDLLLRALLHSNLLPVHNISFTIALCQCYVVSRLRREPVRQGRVLGVRRGKKTCYPGERSCEMGARWVCVCNVRVCRCVFVCEAQSIREVWSLQGSVR